MFQLVAFQLSDDLAISQQPDVAAHREARQQLLAFGEFRLIAHQGLDCTAQEERKPRGITHPIVTDEGMALLQGGSDRALGQFRREDMGRHVSEGPIIRIEIRADQCPRIDPEFLDQERRALGESWYRSDRLAN